MDKLSRVPFYFVSAIAITCLDIPLIRRKNNTSFFELVYFTASLPRAISPGLKLPMLRLTNTLFHRFEKTQQNKTHET